MYIVTTRGMEKLGWIESHNVLYNTILQKRLREMLPHVSKVMMIEIVMEPSTAMCFGSMNESTHKLS